MDSEERKKKKCSYFLLSVELMYLHRSGHLYICSNSFCRPIYRAENSCLLSLKAYFYFSVYNKYFQASWRYLWFRRSINLIMRFLEIKELFHKQFKLEYQCVFVMCIFLCVCEEKIQKEMENIIIKSPSGSDTASHSICLHSCTLSPLFLLVPNSQIKPMVIWK